MVEIRVRFDPVLIPFSSFSPFSVLGRPYLDARSRLRTGFGVAAAPTQLRYFSLYSVRPLRVRIFHPHTVDIWLKKLLYPKLVLNSALINLEPILGI